jgi:hypothetical protein
MSHARLWKPVETRNNHSRIDSRSAWFPPARNVAAYRVWNVMLKRNDSGTGLRGYRALLISHRSLFVNNSFDLLEDFIVEEDNQLHFLSVALLHCCRVTLRTAVAISGGREKGQFAIRIW